MVIQKKNNLLSKVCSGKCSLFAVSESFSGVSDLIRISNRPWIARVIYPLRCEYWSSIHNRAPTAPTWFLSKWIETNHMLIIAYPPLMQLPIFCLQLSLSRWTKSNLIITWFRFKSQTFISNRPFNHDYYGKISIWVSDLSRTTSNWHLIAS